MHLLPSQCRLINDTLTHTLLHHHLLLPWFFFYLFILRSETLWSLMSGSSCSSSPSLPPSLVCRHTTQGQMGGEAPDVSLINSHLTELKNWRVSATEMLIVCNPAINCTAHLCVVVGSYVNKRLNQQQAKWEQGQGQSLKVMQQI